MEKIRTFCNSFVKLGHTFPTDPVFSQLLEEVSGGLYSLVFNSHDRLVYSGAQEVLEGGDTLNNLANIITRTPTARKFRGRTSVFKLKTQMKLCSRTAT